MALCDVVLLGLPQAGWSADIYSFSTLSQISLMRIQAGAFLGLLASFLICFGYWYLWHLLRPFASYPATIMFCALTFYGMMGGVFHAGYYFAGAAIHQGEVALYFRFTQRLQWLAMLAGAGALLGSILYIYMLLMCQYRYSKWYAASNLLLCQGIALAATYVLPAPVGGYLRPTFINLGTILFFISIWIMRANSKEMPRLGAK